MPSESREQRLRRIRSSLRQGVRAIRLAAELMNLVKHANLVVGSPPSPFRSPWIPPSMAPDESPAGAWPTSVDKEAGDRSGCDAPAHRAAPARVGEDVKILLWTARQRERLRAESRLSEEHANGQAMTGKQAHLGQSVLLVWLLPLRPASLAGGGGAPGRLLRRPPGHSSSRLIHLPDGIAEMQTRFGEIALRRRNNS